MDETTFRARVARERGHGVVHSPKNGAPIPCCWTECDRRARRENLVAVREGEKVSIYFFCVERHKMLWLNSSRDMGNLPGGSRGMIT